MLGIKSEVIVKDVYIDSERGRVELHVGVSEAVLSSAQAREVARMLTLASARASRYDRRKKTAEADTVRIGGKTEAGQPGAPQAVGMDGPQRADQGPTEGRNYPSSAAAS